MKKLMLTVLAVTVFASTLFASPFWDVPQTMVDALAGYFAAQTQKTETINGSESINMLVQPVMTVGSCDLATPSLPIEIESTSTASQAVATVSDAFALINNGTHQGTVEIEVCYSSTNNNTAAVLNSSGAGAAVYSSVRIRPLNDSLTISGTASGTGHGVIELNGADNVTIDGDNPNTAGINRNLTIQNSNANTITYPQVIRIALATATVTTADNVTIKNLNIVGNANGLNVNTSTSTSGTLNLSYGIYASGNASSSNATAAPTPISSTTTTIGSGATAANLTIQNNTVINAGRGIMVQGSATTVFPGLLIENNVIGNSTGGAADQVYSFGISAQGSASGIIRGNTVYVESYLASPIRGIDIGSIIASGSSAFTIERNKIARVANANTGISGQGAYGVNLAAGNNHAVRNNFVTGISAVANGNISTINGAHGIRVGTGTGHQIFHNSSYLSGALSGTAEVLTSAFTISGTASTGLDVRNNIFGNSNSGGGLTSAFSCIYLPSSGGGSFNLTLNNNNYFEGPNASNAIAQVGTTSGSGVYKAANFNAGATTPAANLRSYTSGLNGLGTNDSSTMAIDPLFTSTTDLHLKAASPMQGIGANLGVTTDFDGDSRGTTPDVGADEITPVNICDFCNLQFPASFSVPAGSTTEQIFGQIFETGVTESAGPSASVTAQVGYGPQGSDPRSAGGWSWFAASYNVQSGNNDEYVGTFTAPALGTYAYTFRYSLDGETNWTYGDLDGNGSNPSLTFSTAQLGVMTVTAATPTPTPTPTVTAYRSAATGDWDAISTWEVSTDGGGSWVAATSTPTNTNSDSIEIQNGHTVTVQVPGLTIDQTTVDSGGTLIVGSNVLITTLTVADGPGTDLVNNGTVTVNSGVPNGTLAASGTVTNNSLITINGNLQLNSTTAVFGGEGTYTYSSSGTLLFTNPTGSYVVDASSAYWPAANSPTRVACNGAGGVTLNVPRIIDNFIVISSPLVNAGNLTVNGQLIISSGGSMDAAPTYGTLSLLRYNMGTFARGPEWKPGANSQPGYPASVDLVNSATLDLPNGSPNSSFYLSNSLTVDAGSHLNLNSATPLTQPLIIGQSVFNSGTITLSPNGGINLGGNWINSGTLVHNNGYVNFAGSGPQSMTGSTTFGSLGIFGSTARTFTFEAGSTQTVAGGLNLQGAASNLLSLRSSSSGTQWKINASSSQTVAYVNVQDSDANGGQLIAADGNSIDAGNNLNWTFGAPEMNIHTDAYSIPDGFVTPENFGTTGTTFGSVTKRYKVQNLGTANLLLTGTPVVQITGANPADFTVTLQPTTPIAPGGDIPFEITFDPMTAGTRTATVSIADNDSDENPYSFDLTGFAITAPAPTLGTYAATEVSLSGNTTIAPSAAPTDINSVIVLSPSGFVGNLEADRTTGVVRITNAHPAKLPAGSYPITVKAIGYGGVATQTFNLTINTQACAGTSSFTDGTDVANANIQSSVVIGDFNGDGNQDLATILGVTDRVAISYGNGAGGFSFSKYVSVGTAPNAAAVADFDGDGTEEIAVANRGSNSVSIAGLGTTVSLNNSPLSIAVGDLNNDGKLDFATASSGGSILVRLGDGAGGFSNAPDVSLPSRSIVVGDFNNDGNPDIAATSAEFDRVSILLGNGLGGFTVTTPAFVDIGPHGVALGDFNGDGNADLATANAGSNSVSVRLGDGTGAFSDGGEVSVGTNPWSVVIGDFNGDGKQDLAVGNRGSNTVSIRNGDGLGGFSGTSDVAVGADPITVAVGDFDEDGRQDLVTANGNTISSSIRLGTCVPPPTVCDYCDLRSPSSFIVPVGATTEQIFGQIFEAGVTEAAGPSALVAAQVGYGPQGSDPAGNANWTWTSASFNEQQGNNDEYVGTFTAPAAGTYSYTYRYSLDGGTSWTYGDLDGNGSNPGLSFSTAQLGTMTSTAGTVPTDRFRAVGLDAVNPWNDVTTWESSHDGFTWIPATLTPDQNASLITIDAVQRVTVTASVTVDNLSVGSGANLEVASGVTLTVNDGFGTDVEVFGPSELRVRGTLINNGQVKISGGRLADDGDTASITGNSIEYAGGILSYSKSAGLTSDVEFPSTDGPASIWIDGAVTLHAPRTVQFAVNLFDGSQFDITAGFTLGDGCLIQRGTGSFLGTPIFGTYVSVSYQSGTGPMATGSEIPPPGTNVRDLTVATGFPVTLASDVTVDGSITLNHNIITGDKTLTIIEGIPVSGPNLPAQGYVIGNVKRVFSSSDAFVYPIGTANGYSPVTITYNISTPGTYSQTAKATESAHPALIDPTKALSRYWTLSDITGPAAVTADITFNYLDPTDIPATAAESNFLLLQYSGGIMTQTGGTVNTTNNSATIMGVSSFSDWTLSELAVTAAPVSLSGRVRTAAGMGIGNTIVTISGGRLEQPRITRTSTFGYFTFADLEPGATYFVSVQPKKYVISNPTRVVSLMDNMTGFDFVADTP